LIFFTNENALIPDTRFYIHNRSLAEELLEYTCVFHFGLLLDKTEELNFIEKRIKEALSQTFGNIEDHESMHKWIFEVKLYIITKIQNL
jgi:hypothetical protein